MRSSERHLSAAEWRIETLDIDPFKLVRADDILAECSKRTEIQLRVLQHADPLLSGSLAFLDAEATCIWYDASLPKTRRYLILAHEFAHHVLHLPIAHSAKSERLATEIHFNRLELDTELAGYSPVERRERDADEWAAELLLPSAALEAAYFGREQDIESIAGCIDLDASFVARRLRKLLLNAASLADRSTQLKDAGSVLGSLDASQLAAAQSHNRFVLVSAGPGTGKTRTLIGRYEHLVQQQCAKASEVAILTFSRKAAGELCERCALLPSGIAGSPWIGTIHAYAYELLLRFSPEAGLRDNWSVLSPHEAERLMDCRLASFSRSGEGMPTLPVPSLLRAVLKMKEQGHDGSCWPKRTDHLKPVNTLHALDEDEARLQEFWSFYSLYEKTLTEANKVDFVDLLVIARNLLAEQEEVARQVRCGCRHLLIDEFQDLTPAALSLIETMVGDSERHSRDDWLPRLWAVGDRLQSIYRFQSGSASSGIDQFFTRFLGAESYQLTVNYRSSRNLVELLSGVAGKLTASEPDRHQRWSCSTNDAVAVRAQLDDVTITAATDSDSQYDGIAEEVARFSAIGILPNQQAILCRTNSQRDAAVAALSRRGIAVLEGQSWLSSRSVKQLMHKFESVAYSSDGVNASSSSKTGKLRKQTSPTALLESLVFDSNAELRELWRSMPTHPSAPGDLQAIGELLQEASRWETEDEIKVLDQGEAGQARLAAFARHMRGFRRDERRSDNRAALPSAIQDGVRVMTIHAAKGLEFDVVYMPDMVDGLFPRRHSSRREASLERMLIQQDTSNTAIDEESCLFFVGVSRAKRYLRLSYPEQLRSQRSVKPSPYLRLLQSGDAGRTIKTIRWRSSRQNHTRRSQSAYAQLPAASPLKQMTMNDVAAYEACPRQYWYRLNKPTPQPQLEHSKTVSLSDASSVLDAEISRQQKNIIAAATKTDCSDLVAQTKTASKVQSQILHLAGWLRGLVPPGISERVSPSCENDFNDPATARQARARAGVAAGSFPAAPDNPIRCADCAFAYICPD